VPLALLLLLPAAAAAAAGTWAAVPCVPLLACFIMQVLEGLKHNMSTMAGLTILQGMPLQGFRHAERVPSKSLKQRTAC
jgi:hypothetical protein